jgi:hypothetical protein
MIDERWANSRYRAAVNAGRRFRANVGSSGHGHW